ncbi:TPA: hypothetical protein NJ920_004296 [Vibrio parahaemolyticus]|nr:hypothetical protein [Vibrio parahaemolyticus]
MDYQSFNKRFANALATPELKTKQIELTVFKHCIESGFLSTEDKENNSPLYQWYQRVLELNLQSLNLLDQVILDEGSSIRMGEVQIEIEAKAASIVRDLAKRILESDINQSGSSCIDSTDNTNPSVYMRESAF